MEFFGLFIAELIALFFLSRIVTSRLSLAFYRLTHSRKLTIYLIAFLFFPGTVLHELAHALMASLLFVPIGEIDLIPRLEGENVRLGSVQIAKPDPFRRFFIGIAPFLMGSIILLSTLYYLSINHLFSLSHPWFLILAGYVAFEIGNTMFASEKDMEGAIELIIAAVVIGILIYFFAFRNNLIHWQVIVTNPHFIETFTRGTQLLLIPLGIDFLLITIFGFLLRRR